MYESTLKMDYKGQTIVLSVMFVLVGMMFLASTVPEEALAQQHGNGVLKVTVINRANCNNTSAQKCPAYYNMITTVTIIPGGIWAEKKSESFPAGPCEATTGGAHPQPCVGPTKEFQVKPGDPFEIEAKQGSPPNCGGTVFHYYKCVLEPIHFVSNPAPSPGNCGNIETSTGKCEGTMPASGQISVDVNYHWRYD